MTNDFGALTATQDNKTKQTPVSECLAVPPFTNMTRFELANKLLLAEASLQETQKDLTMAARIGQELLKTNQRLQKSNDELLLLSKTCNLAKEDVAISSASFSENEDALKTPRSSRRRIRPVLSNGSPKSPSSFNSNAYIDNVEKRNEELTIQLESTQSQVQSLKRVVQKWEDRCEYLTRENETALERLQILESENECLRRSKMMNSHLKNDACLHDQVDELMAQNQTLQKLNETLLEQLYEKDEQIARDRVIMEELQSQIAQDASDQPRFRRPLARDQETAIEPSSEMNENVSKSLNCVTEPFEAEKTRVAAVPIIVDRILGPCRPRRAFSLGYPRKGSLWTSLKNSSSSSYQGADIVVQFWQSCEPELSFDQSDQDPKPERCGLITSGTPLPTLIMDPHHLPGHMSPAMARMAQIKTQKWLDAGRGQVRGALRDWIEYMTGWLGAYAAHL